MASLHQVVERGLYRPFPLEICSDGEPPPDAVLRTLINVSHHAGKEGRVPKLKVAVPQVEIKRLSERQLDDSTCKVRTTGRGAG